jgi:hypothetical protein
VSNVRDLKREASPGLIATLQQLLKEAESGELVGCGFLCNHGGETAVWSAGITPLAKMILSFEDWKFCQLADRNLQRIQDDGK